MESTTPGQRLAEPIFASKDAIRRHVAEVQRAISLARSSLQHDAQAAGAHMVAAESALASVFPEVERMEDAAYRQWQELVRIHHETAGGLSEALDVSQAQTAATMELIEEWQDASGLEVGGDPGGVTPQHMQLEWVQKHAAAAPFLDVARARLAGQSYEPISPDACTAFLRAFEGPPGAPSAAIRCVVPGGDLAARARLSPVPLRRPPSASETSEVTAPKDEHGNQRSSPTTESAARDFAPTKIELTAQGASLTSTWGPFLMRRVDLVAFVAEEAVDERAHRIRMLEQHLASITRREVMIVRALDEAGVPDMVERAPGSRSSFPEDRVRWLAAQAPSLSARPQRLLPLARLVALEQRPEDGEPGECEHLAIELVGLRAARELLAALGQPASVEWLPILNPTLERIANGAECSVPCVRAMAREAVDGRKWLELLRGRADEQPKDEVEKLARAIWSACMAGMGGAHPWSIGPIPPFGHLPPGLREGLDFAALLVLPRQKQVDELASALEELVGFMDGVRRGSYTPDSFTTQPAREALRGVGRSG